MDEDDTVLATQRQDTVGEDTAEQAMAAQTAGNLFFFGIWSNFN